MNTKRLQGDSPEDQALAANLLRQGCLVAVPNETVYGWAANAVDAKAVQRIFINKKDINKTPIAY